MAVNVTQADDLLFWKEVRHGYDMVSANSGLIIDLMRSSRAIQIWYDSDEDSIFIQINQANSQSVEPLIVPGGE